MKSQLTFSVLFATAAILIVPAWAGPFSSKSQNATPAPQSGVDSETTCAGPQCMTGGKKKMGSKRAMKHGTGKRFMKNLSDEDHARVKAIMGKVRENPDVKAARDAVRQAETPKAKREAWKKLHDVRRAAMSEEDRSYMDGLKQKMKKNAGGRKCPAGSQG